MEKIELPITCFSAFSGVLDKDIKKLGEKMGIRLSVRGNNVLIDGAEERVQFAKYYFEQVKKLESTGYSMKLEDLDFALDLLKKGQGSHLEDFLSNGPLNLPRKSVFPKSLRQYHYIQAIKSHDLVFGIGPAGTGKTYLAMALALSFFQKKEVNRIILTRPAVEAGEKLGYLPGDLQQKINPYLRPLYDALFDLLQADHAHNLIEKGTIEIAPLAYMRGRTLNNAFIILDEAQNTTKEQMKMILTRPGFDSKLVVTADITQIDLPQPRKSGTLQAMKILSKIKEIAFIQFTEKDVVRHPLVQKIIQAYEKAEEKKDKLI